MENCFSIEKTEHFLTSIYKLYEKNLLFCPQTSLQRSPVQHWWQEVNLLGRLLFGTGGKALLNEIDWNRGFGFTKTKRVFKFFLNKKHDFDNSELAVTKLREIRSA